MGGWILEILGKCQALAHGKPSPLGHCEPDRLLQFSQPSVSQYFDDYECSPDLHPLNLQATWHSTSTKLSLSSNVIRVVRYE